MAFSFYYSMNISIFVQSIFNLTFFGVFWWKNSMEVFVFLTILAINLCVLLISLIFTVFFYFRVNFLLQHLVTYAISTNTKCNNLHINYPYQMVNANWTFQRVLWRCTATILSIEIVNFVRTVVLILEAPNVNEIHYSLQRKSINDNSSERKEK